MRKLFISADIEGCAAVASPNALSSKQWEWNAAREWMTNEVKAACEAALAFGYDEIIIADGHGNAQNIIPDALPHSTRLVRSWPRPLLQMEGIQDPEVEGCFFIGYHNGAQGEGGILAHTYHGGAIRDLRVNGESVSEGYLNAALAGEYEKPVLMVCGDSAATQDAKRYSPSAAMCTVKESIGWRAQIAPPPSEACELIKLTASKALEKADACLPFKLKTPLTLSLEMTSRVAPELMSFLPFIERQGPYSVKAQFESVSDAMKFISFAIFYTPAGTFSD